MISQTLIILIAGPYRSGTNDDPILMKENLLRMEEAALRIFRVGHIPVVGEWFALPLLKIAGSKYPGDKIYEEISYPIARRIITKADAVFRIEGASKGADGDVDKARSLGIPVYFKIEEIPGLV